MKRLLALGIITLAIFVFSRGLSSKVRPVQGEHDQSVFVKNFSIPGYSPVARQALIQGDVSAVIHVGADGNVGEVDVEGQPLLREPLAEVLRSWKFINLSHQPQQENITFRYILQGKGTDTYAKTTVSGELPGVIEIVTNPPAPLGPDVIPNKKH